MQVEPDARQAAADRGALTRRMGLVLERAELPLPPAQALHRPAVVEVVHTVQRDLRSGPLGADRIRELQTRLAVGPAPMCAPVDPQDHLSRSLARALRSVPVRADVRGRPAGSEVAGWQAGERRVLEEALALLEEVWPQGAAEMRETVVEVALLDGHAIEGFTDFTVHGAVLVNRTRLREGANGLPGPVRCAEALVHEGAHTRCNAAASLEPFLLPDPGATAGGGARPGGSGGLLVATPLRSDLRPLSGLFQQAVVLARSVLFYRRLTVAGAAASQRHAKLAEGGAMAVRTLDAHADSLTRRGRRVLEECASVLGGRG
ncbi:aKG-HExxH-type peptide beta-hydroxylase [Streptomyces sp. NPDC054904]|uniref:aKG-HExxH-type peptide beta-hydroxylase n=1 Tax=unclassified Streptomyces TaxID=2593676 RepID=UPI0024819EDC|nr:HEXXH motif-containing putative peptide modification protein [Streptomyces sp. Isolate_45]MDA5284312.1 HEXXH motif-containing putative peptide modification protein [Streptomyces sp. Isolate_45]